MNLTEVPFFVAKLANSVQQAALVQQLRKLNKAKPDAMLKLMKAMCAELKRMKRELEVMAGEVAPSTERVTVRLAMQKKWSALHHVLTTFTDGTRAESRAYPQTIPMLSAAWFLIKHERILGTLRSLEKLTILMDRVHFAADHDKIVELVSKTNEITKCEHCRKWEYVGKLANAWGDIKICRACATNRFVYSDYYGFHINNDYFRRAIHRDNTTVYIHEDDEDFMFNEDRDQWHHVDWVPPPPPILGNYHSSKPYQSPVVDEWSAERHRWFGVELEVEIHDHRADRLTKAQQIHEVINEGERGKRAFFENDGSLSNGFEIVTQPMSLPMHQQFWNWLSNRELVKDLRSHNTSTCGLHVHVNKDNLDKLVQAKIVTFVNDPNNKDLIVAVARRYAEGYCKIKSKDLNNALATTDRYEAVNVTGRRTMEFRIFKGSLKYESVMAAIEFVNALVSFAKDDTGTTADALKIDNFIEYINNQAANETTTLRPYLNQRLERA